MSPRRERVAPPAAEVFTGIYCSGVCIDDPALLTAMCLLFDRVYVPNYISDLKAIAPMIARMRRLRFDKSAWTMTGYSAITLEGEMGIEMMRQLAEIEAESGKEAADDVMTYFILASTYFMRYEPLLGSVVETDFYRRGHGSAEPKAAKVTSDTVGNPVIFFRDAQSGAEAVQERLDHGAIPVLNSQSVNVATSPHERESFSTSRTASLLALSAVQLALPQTRGASAEDILEARERLKDHLKPFWAAMLRLSTQFQEWHRLKASQVDIETACVEYVNTTIRPDLIELNTKLLKEHRNWAHKIIHPIADGVQVALNKSHLSVPDLVAIALQTALNVAAKFSDAPSRSPTLAYLVQIEREMQKAQIRT